MKDENLRGKTIPLDRQLLELRKITDSIYDTLHNEGRCDADDLLEEIAHLSGTLNRLSRQIAQKQSERDNLQALASMSQVVNSSLHLDDVLCIVMDTIIRLTGAERGFLMLRSEQGEMILRVGRNWIQENIDPSELSFSRTVLNQVIGGGQPVLTTNATQDPRFEGQNSVVVNNLRSILCVPLKMKDELTGVIYADNRVRIGLFTEAERDLLAGFANQAAVAIENARLFESVQKSLAEVSTLKNLMDDIFASIASGVITANQEDEITLSNRAADLILDVNGGSLAGRKLADLLPANGFNLGEYLKFVRQTNRQIVGLELSPELPHRGKVNLSLNLSPLKDGHQTTHGVAIVLEDLTEKKRLEGMRRLFERMVSPAVIEQLDPNQIKLGGERAEITTLFADIRGFTSFSERLDPEQLLKVLNGYMGAATEAVLAQEGTIDKFIGDALMAFFNAPIPQADHVLRAVKAAIGIRKAVRAISRYLPEKFALSFGIGIHTGEAVLGLLGAEKRMDYTAIGDSINTAKRIQESALAGQILISAETYQRVKQDIRAFPIPPLHAKGKRDPIAVYEVIGFSSEAAPAA